MSNGPNELLVYGFLAVSLFFVLWGLRDLIRTLQIIVNRGLTEGVAVDTRMRKMHALDDEPTPCLTVRFQTAEGRVIEYEQRAPGWLGILQHSARSLPRLEGQGFAVHYDRTQPRRATVSPLGDLLQAVILLGFGLFMSLACLSNVL